MIYYKEILLKDGRVLVLRNGERKDAEYVLNNFISTHKESDYLLSLPEECSFTVEKEEEYLQVKKNAERDIELLGIVDGVVVGTAGIDGVGRYKKISHRCTFGISISKEYWGQGIGKALTEASIECAKKAGYHQVELEVVKDNERAMRLYKNLGFEIYGENDRGFIRKSGDYQTLILMRKILF